MLDPKDIADTDYWIAAQFRGAKCKGWERIKKHIEESAKQADNSAITPPEPRDCDTCANDGECNVTVLKCKGYVRAAQ